MTADGGDSISVRVDYAPVDSLILGSIWAAQIKLVGQDKDFRKMEVGRVA